MDKNKYESLENFVNKNVCYKKNHMYYNESFCMCVADYIGVVGTFSENDIKFLAENNYLAEDFIEV